MSDPGESTPSTWEFKQPGRFTVGAIGEAGHRVFYFQAFADGTEVNVKCEKQQAAALVGHLVGLLADLPAEAEGAVVESVEALPPSDVAFVVGSISIGVDRSDERIVVMLEELILDPEDEELVERDPSRLRVHLTRGQVRSLAHQVEHLLASSRPLCRLCEQPIDPDGHACARLN
ncbi:MAG: DUF3090 family protein [Aquihabitans sp.]